jgi:hypothetical protein
MNWSRSLSIAALGATSCVVLASLAVFTFAWGRGQALTPETVAHKLTIGMSVSEAEAALAMPPGSLDSNRESLDRGFAVYAADSGVGCMFFPQYSICLVFDEAGGLDRCLAEVHWRCDETYVPVDLATSQR